MKTLLINIVRNYPVFLYLLPVFFVLHGYTENYDLIPAKDAIVLTCIYLLVSALLSVAAWLLYRNFTKANLLAFWIMAFHFFFGAVQDILKKTFPDSFVNRYIFILPFFLLVFILIIISLKRMKKKPVRFSFFLNSLFLILIIIDGIILLSKSITEGKTIQSYSQSIAPCDTCSKQDIYLVMADGYPGLTELKDLFNYDNTPFISQLKQRGFHVVDSSTSNYNFTPFSVSSMLDMNYLENIAGSNSNKHDIALCYKKIKRNTSFTYFSQLGYSIYNYSIFDLEKQPSLTAPTFLPRKTTPITSQTFLSRIERELGHHLVTSLKIKTFIKSIREYDLRNNNKLFDKTKAIVKEQNMQPKFVYTHLVIPHYPYYFDSTGKSIPYEKLTEDLAFNKEAFISYLKYSNNQLLNLTDYILATSKKPPVIILMSDHGFREFKEATDKKYHFLNLNAIYFPDRNYSSFYKGMSNINQFRILFNSQFGQQLSLLKDSSSFLSE